MSAHRFATVVSALVACVMAACGGGSDGSGAGGASGAGGSAGTAGSGGGAVQTLFEDGQDCLNAPMVVGDLGVYFVTSAASGQTCSPVGDLRRVPKAGGAAETVVSGIDVSGGGLGFGALAATGGLVYVASNSGVSRWNESTTTLETIHAEPAAELRVDDAGQYVYWTTTDPTTYKAGIHRQLSSGGSIEEIVAGEPAVQSFAVDATHVYYAGNHEIDRVPLAGGTTETVLLTDTAVRIEIAGDFIYWLSFDKADFGTVHRVAKTGGTDEVLGSGDVGLNALAVDSAHIYFADGSGNGGLVSVDLQTKTAYPLETGVLYTHVLVADGEYVYIKDVLGVRRTLKWP